MFEALIVGAGPAGSSLALRLRRRGLDVAILERSRFPRTKVCGEYLSPGAVKALRDLGTLEAVAANAHPIRSIRLAAFDAGPIELRLPGVGALAIPRADLDALLLSAALDAGARFIAGSYMTSAERDGTIDIRYRDADGVEVTVQARALAGADGAWSTVGQRSGLAAGSNPRSGRWAVGGHLHDQPDSDVLEMFAGKGGYYARNPLGGGLVNAMLVMPRPTPDDEAEDVALQISGGRRRFEGALLEKRVAVGPLRYLPRAVARGRVVLTGDAAGLLDPFTGQGVALALALSEPAAEAVVGLVAITDEPQTIPIVRTYSSRYRAMVEPRRRLAAAIDSMVRIPLLRRRALARFKRDPRWADEMLAAVAGA